MSYRCKCPRLELSSSVSLVYFDRVAQFVSCRFADVVLFILFILLMPWVGGGTSFESAFEPRHEIMALFVLR